MKREHETADDWGTRSVEPPSGAHSLFAWSVITGVDTDTQILASGAALALEAAKESTEAALYNAPAALGLVRRVPMNEWLRHADPFHTQPVGIATVGDAGDIHWEHPEND